MTGKTAIPASRPKQALLLFVTLVLGVTLACEGDPVGADTSGEGLLTAGETIPFKAVFDGSFVVLPFDDPGIPVGTPVENCPVGEAFPDLGIPAGFPNGGGVAVFQGTGWASHLGRISVLQTNCAIQFFPETDPPLASFDIHVTLTAANGDQLFVENDFESFFIVGQEGGPFTVVGGTGRFEGATGILDGPKPRAPQNGDFVVTCTDGTPFCLSGISTGGWLSGTISTVGSNP